MGRLRYVAALAAAALGAACSLASPTSDPALLALRAGREPGAPSIGAGAVWVPNTGDGTVTRIDAGTGRITATIRIGQVSALLKAGCAPSSEHAYYFGSFNFRDCDLPKALMATDQAVWVTKNDGAALLRLDPGSGRIVATIPIGINGWDVWASPTEVWVTDYDASTAVVVDPASNRVRARYGGVAEGSLGTVAAAGSVWIAGARQPYQVSRLDPAAGLVVARIQAATEPEGVVAAAGSVWIRCLGSLDRIDPATNTVIASVPVSGPVRKGLDRMAVSGSSIWVAGLDLEEVDTRTNRVRARLPIEAVGVAAAGRTLWVSDARGRVLRIRV